MILVDTSVWTDHLRSEESGLSAALESGLVMTHPFILGELACGNLINRDEILGLLGDLPTVSVATEPEVLGFIQRHTLMGRGIGYIDMHLLAATALAGDVRLWTRDRRLADAALDLGRVHDEK